MEARVIVTGITYVGILCNISYAGMRAQGEDRTRHWRKAAFIGGFPSTCVSWWFIPLGGGRAFGIDCPPRPKNVEMK